MKDEDVTAQIMSAWEEVVADEERPEPEAAVVTEKEEPEEEEVEAAPSEEPQEEEPEEEEEGEDEGEEQEAEPGEEDEEQEPAEPPAYDDVEIQAFLAKYGGDTEKALKGAADLYRLMGRRDDEKLALTQQVEQLQGQLAQAQAFGAGAYLSEEQQAWAETAAESANPGVYVQQALNAEEYELARAVCREWATTNPFEAMRAGQLIDAVQFQVEQQAQAPDEVPPATTWNALAQNYPELRQYEEQMVETLGRLGPEHPLVQEARSTDPAQAVRGIFGIYEIAKAATFSLAEARNGVKRKRRQEADDAIDNAAVTSGAATPSTSETPRRQRSLMPGLTQEQFDSAFDAEFARQ